MSSAIRIRRDVETAVMRVLDKQVAAGATTRALGLDYVNRLRAVAAALRAEADEIELLADAEERDLPPPRVLRRNARGG